MFGILIQHVRKEEYSQCLKLLMQVWEVYVDTCKILGLLKEYYS